MKGIHYKGAPLEVGGPPGPHALKEGMMIGWVVQGTKEDANNARKKIAVFPGVWVEAGIKRSI